MLLMTTPIPVTLVTGFLGAGKTTLLKHILHAKTGLRFAIIENEFGDVGIDGSLVSVPQDALFELNDGCVCCTVRDDLLDVFAQLAARRDAFDHIIIETTGLADPTPVMRIFEQPSIRENMALSGVVTVVDAEHIEQSLADSPTCAEQITYADLLVINKADRLTARALDTVEAHLRKRNPLASIVRAEHARVNVDTVLHLNGRSWQTSPPDHHAHTHHHDDEIGSVVVEIVGDVDVVALDHWLDQLTRRPELQLLRMKGILAVPGDIRRFVFHGVRRVIDVRPDRPWGTDPRHSRIVLIGRGLDPTALQREFSLCTVDDEPSINSMNGPSPSP